MKKQIATILSLTLALLSPGLWPYQAFAQVVTGELPAESLHFEGAPLSQDPSLSAPDASLGLSAPQSQGSLSAAPLQSLQGPAGLERAAGRADAALAGSEGATRSISRQAESRVEGLRRLGAAEEPNSGVDASRDVNRELFDRESAKPSAAAPEYTSEADLAGKRILVVGSLKSRPWILTDAKRLADKYGMKIAIVDSKEQRPNSVDLIADAEYIEADVDNHSPENEKAIVEKVGAWARSNPIHLSVGFLNQYAQLAARIADKVGALGDPGDGVARAHDKRAAREAMSKVARISTPAREVTSAEDARKAFAEIAGPGGKVVLKPIKGGGSEGVIVDVDSPESAAATWTKVDGFIREFMKRPDAAHSNLDQYPGILMERQLEGPEIDAEFVVRKGADGKPKVDFFMVSDNPPMDKPLTMEKGVTFPSQLPPHIWDQIKEAGLLALESLGLSEGNAHIEMIITPEGPKILEVNKRMGGLFVKPLVERVTGFNLVQGALRAYLNLPPAAQQAPQVTLEARMGISKTGGIIEKIEGVEEAKRMPGFERIVMLKQVGDKVEPPEKDMFDYPFYLSAVGANYDEAFGNLYLMIDGIKLHLRQPDGSIVVERMSNVHYKDDPNALLAKVTAEQKARASQTSAGEQASGREAPKPDEQLPKSFWTYLTGVVITGMAQEALATIGPLYAAGALGVGFAVLTQGVQQIMRIPGAIIGKKYVRMFDSRKVYMAANVIGALSFVAIPASFFLHATPGVIQGVFLAYSAIAGVNYGATRGVAEKEITPRIMGQASKSLLKKANSWYFVAVEPACFLAAFLVGAAGISDKLAPVVHVGAAIGGVLLALSAVPFAFIKYKEQAPKAAAADEEEKGGTEDHLPLKTYAPYAFFNFVHQAFYSLLAWSMAVEILKNGNLTSWITGFYDMGSFAISALGMAAVVKVAQKLGIKKLLPGWSPKQWTVAATGAMAAFVWGSLIAHNPLVTIVAAAALGAGNTVMNVEWSSVFQKQLKMDKQPRVYQNLMIASVLGSLVPFAIIKGGMALNLGFSVPALLMVVAVAMTAMGAGVLWAIRGDGQKAPEAPKRS